MSRKFLEQRLYQTVNLTTTVNQDYVIPNGATLVLYETGACAPNNQPDQLVKIIWDPSGVNQLVYSAYSDNTQPCNSEFIGDGTKIIRILLINNGSSSYTLGCFFQGILLQ